MKIQAPSLYHKAYFALIILAGTLLIFSLKDQPGLTYDSHDYIDASAGVATYLAGENADGFAYTLRPPLYPLYLFFFEDKILAAWCLNVICFVASLWLIVLIAEHLKWRPIWKYAGILLVALSLPWLQNHFFVWTEPLFSSVLLLLIYFLLKRKSVAIIVVTCLILFSIRKAGLFIIIVTCIYYLLNKQYRNFLWLGAISAVFVIGWEMIVTSFADRSPFLSNLDYLVRLDRSSFIDVLTAWILPRKIPVILRIALIVVGIASTVIISRNQFTQFLGKEHNKLFITYLLGYCLFFIVVVGSTGFDETERYLSVVVPLFILIVMSFASEMRDESKRTKQIFYSLFLLWSLYPLTRTVNYFLTTL